MNTSNFSWLPQLWHALAARPWLAAVLAAVVVGAVFGRDQLLAWRHRRHTIGAQWVTIAAPPEVTPESAAGFWTTMVECSPRRCGGDACTKPRTWRGNTRGPAGS